jgi:carboxylate-amine ligase
MYRPSFNIGIEEEYQMIEPDSRALLGYVTQSMAKDRVVIQERTPEFRLEQQMDGAVLEAGTPVCADIKEAREQLLRVRNSVLESAEASGVRVAAAGTHPFTNWEAARYRPATRQW